MLDSDLASLYDVEVKQLSSKLCMMFLPHKPPYQHNRKHHYLRDSYTHYGRTLGSISKNYMEHIGTRIIYERIECHRHSYAKA